MTADEKSNKMLRWAKIAQGLCIVAAAIYVRILAQGQAFGYIPIEQLDTLVLNILTVVLTLFAVYALVFAYFWPQYLAKSSRRSPLFRRRGPEMRALSAFVTRCAFFESVAICGLMLGLLGAGWAIIAPFLAVAAVSLIVAFPTKRRWDKMLQTLRDEPA